MFVGSEPPPAVTGDSPRFELLASLSLLASACFPGLVSKSPNGGIMISKLSEPLCLDTDGPNEPKLAISESVPSQSSYDIRLQQDM